MKIALKGTVAVQSADSDFQKQRLPVSVKSSEFRFNQIEGSVRRESGSLMVNSEL